MSILLRILGIENLYLVLSYTKTLFELCVISDYHNNPGDTKAVSWRKNSTVERARSAGALPCNSATVSMETAHVVIDSYQALFAHNRSASEQRSPLPKSH